MMDFSRHFHTQPDALYLEHLTKSRWEVSSTELQEAEDILYGFVQAERSSSCSVFSSEAEVLWSVLSQIYSKRCQKEGKHHWIFPKGYASALSTFYEDSGCLIHYFSYLSTGEIDVEAWENSITPKSSFAIIPLVHAVTGVVQDIERISALCRKHNIFLLIDARYAGVMLPIHWPELGGDALWMSGDLMGAPMTHLVFMQTKEICLCENKDVRLITLAHMCKRIVSERDHRIMQSYQMRLLFEQKLKEKLSVQILFEGSKQLPHLLTVAFEEIWYEALQYRLQQVQLYTTIVDPKGNILPDILEMFQVPRKHRYSALAFALPSVVTEEELNQVVLHISREVSQLATISGGVWR